MVLSTAQQQAPLITKDPIEIFKWYTKSGFPPKNAPRYDAHAIPIEKAMGTHKIQGDRFCFDSKTEVFTREGWVHFQELKITDEILTFNPLTRDAEYHKPEGLSRFWNTQPMVRIGGQDKPFDLLVSPEHSLFLREKPTEQEAFFAAASLVNLAKKTLRYSILCQNRNRDFDPKHPLSQMTWMSIQATEVRYETYVGPVYCLTVKNHIILVRRNRKVCWCGQTGKSALGETIAYMYLRTGGTIYDIYAANDQENAAWLYSPWASHVTLLTGSNCKLRFEAKEYRQMKAIDLIPKDQGPGNIFVACKRFFQTEDDYYRAMWGLSTRFKDRTTYDRVDAIFIREAQEVITGVQRAGAVRSEKDAASAFTRFHNQLFHFGYAAILDSQREVEIAKSVRELADWNYFKNMGGMEIPRKYWHTFHHANPDSVYREMEPWQFIIYAKGKTGLGRFLMPPWHIQRGVDILETRLRIFPEFSGPTNTPIPTVEGGTPLGGPGRPKEFVLRQEIRKAVIMGKSYAQIEVELNTSDKTITKVKKQMKIDGEIGGDDGKTLLVKFDERGAIVKV